MTLAAHDPGGKVRTRLPDGMVGWAKLSECGCYRYMLGRSWSGEKSPELLGEPYALWIGMNPSTADADVNDPTITREIAFTKQFGLDCMVKVNVMDYRATDPKWLAKVQARSGDNLPTILGHAENAERVIAAWGALPQGLRWTAMDVRHALKGIPLWCLGCTKDGSPRHPLYVPKTTELMVLP